MGVNRVMLIVSVVLGVLAMLLGFIYLSTLNTSPEASGEDALAQQRTVAILQVTRDLPAGHRLSGSADLKSIDVPRDAAAQLVQASVKAVELATVEGRELGLPVAAGQMLSYAHFVQARDIDLAPDRRAYALEISGAEALQGLLMPGDRIDLIILRPKQADPVEQAGIDPSTLTEAQAAQLAQAQLGSIFSQMAREIGGRDGFDSEIILEDVRVLAVGTRLAGSRLELVTSQREFAQRGNMITLDVSIEEALMLAEESAHQFRVLLRPKLQQQTTAEPAGAIGGGMSSGLDGGR